MDSRYARIERERRFLLDGLPREARVVRVRQINDLYIAGTRLRLREQAESGERPIYKLTQKIPSPDQSGQQGVITNMYLSENEFRVLSALPGQMLSKTRHSVPPFGIDVFSGALTGLCVGEAEFDSAEAARDLFIPSFAVAEVTADARFTGGTLVRASRAELQSWLSEYGVKLMPAAVD